MMLLNTNWSENYVIGQWCHQTMMWPSEFFLRWHQVKAHWEIFSRTVLFQTVHINLYLEVTQMYSDVLWKYCLKAPFLLVSKLYKLCFNTPYFQILMKIAHWPSHANTNTLFLSLCLAVCPSHQLMHLYNEDLQNCSNMVYCINTTKLSVPSITAL